MFPCIKKKKTKKKTKLVIDVKRGEVQWVKFEVKGDEAPLGYIPVKKKKKNVF